MKTERVWAGCPKFFRTAKFLTLFMVSIALVMTLGILGGIICCILFLKKYLGKLSQKPKTEAGDKPGFGAYATTAMFVGLCAAYIGSYIGKLVPGEYADGMPLFVAVVAAVCMAGFEYLIQKKNKKVLENFSLLSIYCKFIIRHLSQKGWRVLK